jgi:hypothetical protein
MYQDSSILNLKGPLFIMYHMLQCILLLSLNRYIFMKTLVILIIGFALLTSACKKNNDDDAQALTSDYRDRFTGSYTCHDSSAIYNLLWSGGLIQGLRLIQSLSKQQLLQLKR